MSFEVDELTEEQKAIIQARLLANGADRNGSDWHYN